MRPVFRPIKLKDRVHVEGHGYGVKIGTRMKRGQGGYFYGPTLTAVRLDDGTEVVVEPEKVRHA